MKNLECLQNPKTGEVRVAIQLGDGFFAVVKLFRDDEETFSVKVWCGDYQATKAHWKTTVPVGPDKSRIFFAVARDTIKRLAALLKKMPMD